MIDAINRVDPAITIATLAEYAPVEKGQMVATVKIIPFAVRPALVDAVGDDLRRRRDLRRQRRSGRCRSALIQTVLPGIKDSVLAKTRARSPKRGWRARAAGVTAERRTRA